MSLGQSITEYNKLIRRTGVNKLIFFLFVLAEGWRHEAVDDWRQLSERDQPTTTDWTEWTKYNPEDGRKIIHNNFLPSRKSSYPALAHLWILYSRKIPTRQVDSTSREVNTRVAAQSLPRSWIRLWKVAYILYIIRDKSRGRRSGWVSASSTSICFTAIASQ